MYVLMDDSQLPGTSQAISQKRQCRIRQVRLRGRGLAVDGLSETFQRAGRGVVARDVAAAERVVGAVPPVHDDEGVDVLRIDQVPVPEDRPVTAGE